MSECIKISMQNPQRTCLFLRKTYMTLLETLIAFSLLSIVLVFVFGFFRELAEITRLTDQTQKESFTKRYLESRLSYIFERIVNEKESGRIFYFYAQPPNRNHWHGTSLILTFNNEVRRDPNYSGDVLGRLYVDNKDHTLRLAIWPLHVKEPHEYMQEEILFENVVNVNYSFYAAPEKIQNAKEIHSGKKIDPDEKFPEKDKWHENEWPATYNEMPSLMKMTVEVPKNQKDLESYRSGMRLETEPLTFYFVLPSSKNPVHYPPQEDKP